MTAVDGIDARLAALRGSLKTKRPNARSVAASLDSPGCRRRAVLDAAQVDKGQLARLLGHPFRDEQSPFALRRGNLFEDIVTRDGCAHLLAQLRERLGLEVPHARFKDLSISTAATSGEKEMRLRAAETRAALRRLADGDDSAYNVLRHAVTTLRIGDSTVFLEQDALAFLVGGKLHVVEIKGFPVIAGVPVDQAHLEQAARQTAVYVLSLVETLTDIGLPAELVSTDVLLVCAKNYGLTPTSAILDVRREIRSLARQLSRRTRIKDLLDELDPTLTFPAGMTAEDAEESLEALPNEYLPSCLSGCELAYYCRLRAVAAGAAGALGIGTRNALGGLDDVPAAAAAAATGIPPRPEDVDVVAALAAGRRAFLAAGGAA
ncbi:hypothetical protein [Pseudonocardia humida]|uniref:PD-(D/E)XK nuclease superfamily protein n=1 Tax=Pseudonocardia humida TaxID=2800819 RepID=A0ABT1A874_9PSEU|nr:hypothetical protein [Pseudonocardia humida]MCO1658909.1 hypothetical protein [Pseudonocardia humida]